MHPDFTSIDDALEHSSVFVVRPVSKESVIANGRDLLTWYRVRVGERLTAAPPFPLMPSIDEAPAGFFPRDPPSGADELLLLQHGGTATVDRVTFSQREAGFPQLQLGMAYLCFLLVAPDGRSATPEFGGVGVFEIRGDRLTPLGKRSHPLTAEIGRSFSNSLTRLAAYVHGLKRVGSLQ